MPRAGRSWLEAPKDKRKENDHCFLPKRWIHTWSGHTKGVNAIRFFPGSGHLLLSAGLDGKVKIWDTAPEGTGEQYQVIIESPFLDVVCPPNAYESAYELWTGGG